MERLTPTCECPRCAAETETTDLSSDIFFFKHLQSDKCANIQTLSTLLLSSCKNSPPITCTAYMYLCRDHSQIVDSDDNKLFVREKQHLHVWGQLFPPLTGSALSPILVQLQLFLLRKLI